MTKPFAVQSFSVLLLSVTGHAGALLISSSKFPSHGVLLMPSSLALSFSVCVKDSKCLPVSLKTFSDHVLDCFAGH